MAYLYRAEIHLVIAAEGLDSAAAIFRNASREISELFPNAVVSASSSITDLHHAPDLDGSLKPRGGDQNANQIHGRESQRQ